MRLLHRIYFLLAVIVTGLSSNVYAALCNDVFPPTYLENGPKLDVPNFPNFSSNRNRSNRYLTLTPGNYSNVNVTNYGRLTFNNNNNSNSNFYIKQLNIGYDSDVVFSPGDYWIESFNIEPFGYIRTSGNGQVRIFVKNKLDLRFRGYWDSDGSRFLVVAKDIKLERGVYVNAIMYASNTFEGENTLHIDGAIAARDFRGNGFSPVFSHKQALLDNTDFASMCSDSEPFVPTVLLDMRFDEPQWSNTGSVTDSSGKGNHGTSFGATPQDDQFCRAADFGNGRSQQRIRIGHEALDGERNLSISAWVKTDSRQLLTVLSGARSGSDTQQASNEITAMLSQTGNNHRPWLNVQEYPFDRDTRSPDSRRINDQQWHHIVWTREIQSSNLARHCYFVDGAVLRCATTNNTGPLNIDPLGLVLGQEQDRVDGGFDSNQAYQGRLDELLIVNWPLNNSEVTSIRTNTLNGLTWDGRTKTCEQPELVAPVLDMRFEEQSFSGVNAVIDSSANSYHGTAFNVDTYADGKYCGAANFNGTNANQFMRVNKDVFDNARDFTVVAWMKTRSNNGQTFFSVANNRQANEAVTLIDGGYGTRRDEHRFWMTIMDRSFSSAQQSGNVASLNDGNWHQVAFVRDTENRRSCYYVDGAFLSCVTENDTGLLNVDDNGVYFGQEQDRLGGDFDRRQALDAYVDEVLVFHKALNTQEIKTLHDNIDNGLTWDGQGRTCRESLVDHYRFEMPATNLTCQASELTLKACADDSCALASTNVSATLVSPSGVTWSGSDVNGNIVSFNDGETTLSLANINAGTMTLGLTDRIPEPTSPTPVRCFIDATEVANCGINFSDSGFVFSHIPTQVSGKPSNLEFNRAQLSIKALKKGDDFAQTGVCSNVFPANSTVDVGFKYICDTPGMCDANGPIISNADTAGTELVQGRYEPVTLRFNDSVIAPFTMEYPDTGILRIAAGLADNTSTPIGEEFEGTSNSFMVKPFGLRLTPRADGDITENNGVRATRHNGTIYTKAGKDFYIQADIVGWQSGQDGNPLDGYADSGVDLSLNTKVNSLNWGTVTLTHSRVSPSGGSVGGFDANKVVLSDSSSTITARWSEVGIINLTGQLIDDDTSNAFRLPWGDTLQGSLANLGRFIPDHFFLIKDEQQDGILGAQCTVLGQANFAYIGAVDGAQGILDYDVRPSITVAAKNAQGVTVNNYQGDFNKLVSEVENINVIAPLTDPALDSIGSPMSLSSIVNQGVITPASTASGGVTKGHFVYQLAETDHFTFVRNQTSKVAPFQSSFELVFAKFEDSDGVTLPDLDSNSLPDLPTLIPQGVEMRFGRAFLQNAYGPEEQPLTVPLEYHYWNGTRFIVNPADCSVYAQDDATLSPLDGNNQFGDIDQDDFTNTPLISDKGLGGIMLPASNLIGTVQMTVEVPEWLKYNWSGGALYDQDPSAEVIFGRYRGNDRLINWREIR